MGGHKVNINGVFEDEKRDMGIVFRDNLGCVVAAATVPLVRLSNLEHMASLVMIEGLKLVDHVELRNFI